MPNLADNNFNSASSNNHLNLMNRFTFDFNGSSEEDLKDILAANGKIYNYYLKEYFNETENKNDTENITKTDSDLGGTTIAQTTEMPGIIRAVNSNYNVSVAGSKISNISVNLDSFPNAKSSAVTLDDIINGYFSSENERFQRASGCDTIVTVDSSMKREMLNNSRDSFSSTERNEAEEIEEENQNDRNIFVDQQWSYTRTPIHVLDDHYALQELLHLQHQDLELNVVASVEHTYESSFRNYSSSNVSSYFSSSCYCNNVFDNNPYSITSSIVSEENIFLENNNFNANDNNLSYNVRNLTFLLDKVKKIGLSLKAFFKNKYVVFNAEKIGKIIKLREILIILAGQLCNKLKSIKDAKMIHLKRFCRYISKYTNILINFISKKCSKIFKTMGKHSSKLNNENKYDYELINKDSADAISFISSMDSHRFSVTHGCFSANFYQPDILNILKDVAKDYDRNSFLATFKE
ncbi:uncharacterized protein SCDLUD_001130 [Saccharomycodes ludwigii]|uniref:uncharacterized protein n=1 Tax=Saccharomycodes ludwigii TaxID=36035 RepID=UPI001E8C7B91|nr:hypothetical protein SCDLUD_001130 [Saccharomycodes ludwigii]KAH3903490.1 hypothetical protein SCDLUD_001130 [Saccharomycodes ludwigii]